MQKAFIILALLALLVACSKMDDYRDKYMSNGSIVYPGKMDSVRAFSGNSRAEIWGLFTSDPKITKFKVFWNSRQDSIEVPVVRTTGVDTASVIIPSLPEGLMSFEVRTYDAHGNISIPVTATANIYGELYQSALSNRAIANAELQDDGAALITWADVSGDAGTVSMRIKYTDSDGGARDTVIASVLTDMTSRLPNFKKGSAISYQTAYLPNATAIDTFYTAYETHPVKADVTSIYMQNTGPFERATYDGGRWGTLAAPWVTTANVVNHAGYGGYASETWLNAGGFLVMESGWSGTANIVNGKISQTTTLPAGNYIFQTALYTEALDPVYIVAAAGSSLPDVSGVGNALGYGTFPTSRNVSANVEFRFTLDKEEEVTLGFVATMTSGNQYWRVGSVKLIKN